MHESPLLNDWAKELLEENGVACFLKNDDFVFLMHQGYVFCYFKADGTEDPDVYQYIETDPTPEKIGPLSEFVQARRMKLWIK